MRLRRLDHSAGWFGRARWGIEVLPNIIGGEIAVRQGYDLYGRRTRIYTAFYPHNGDWKYKEFQRFRDALAWLKSELKKKWEQ